MTRELFCLKSKITVHVEGTPEIEKTQLPESKPSHESMHEHK